MSTDFSAQPPSPSTPPPRHRRRLVLGVGLIVFVAALAGGAWWWAHRKPPSAVVLAANNVGVGLMEQFKYKEAVPAFEEVVRLDPDWIPGHINLGIALMNAGADDQARLKRAREIFEGVLLREPDNPYAHFCLGIMLMYQEEKDKAVGHFEAVTRIDPGDASAWYWLGHILPPGSAEADQCFRKAFELDPNQSGALHQYAMGLRLQDMKKARALLDQQEALKKAEWLNLIGIKYTEMGRYADVIGRQPAATAARTGPLPVLRRSEKFSVQLAPGARWARAADFGKGPVAEVRALVRARFGGTVAVFDYNRDGKPDLFLAGAVVEKEQVRDLLLRNDGDGRFTDVTADAGLALPHPTLGCCVADFDNDDYPDLLLTGAGSQRLFRNTGKGKFEDVTARATLDRVTSVCLGAAFIDLDQDSDLDLLIAEYAATPAEALQALEGGKAAGGGLLVYLHVGEAPPALNQDKAPPLECKFQRQVKGLAALRGEPGPVVGLAATDLDGDRDLDFLVLRDRATPAVVLNDRLLRFRRRALPEKVAGAGRWNGALVLDVDHDGRSDLLLVAPDRPPRLLLNRATPTEKDVGRWFEDGALDAPPLLQAVAIDLDLDTWTDVVGLSAERVPVLLHNEGGRLVLRRDALGSDGSWPKDLLAVTAFDGNGDGLPDLLVWSEAGGLQLYENGGNGHHGLQLEPRGYNAVQGQNRVRCNADGIGVWAVAQTADLWAGQENTTLSAGLGQSRLPLWLGLGRYPRADVVRLRWPDGCRQAELDQPAGAPVRIGEWNRKPGSCPILFGWDGKRFAFVTDFLGAGSVGEQGPDGTCRPPRPEESVKIEADRLAPRDGHYLLDIAEPMDEVTYLDRLRLVVVDHPADVHVYPDERFPTGGPPPSQQLFSFRECVFPVQARDHRGRDVTGTLRAWDRDTVDDFARRSWLGFAEDHGVELEFGDRLSGFRPDDRLFLCLAGWTDYPTPESIWAAHQAGVEMRPPVLERLGADGKWRPLAEAGFPAGLPKMMTLEMTGKLTGPRCRLRLRTNLRVYWDQVFVAARCHTVEAASVEARKGKAGEPAVRATCLEVADATLKPCGMMQEFAPDGREPTAYDHDRYEAVPVVRPAGRITRYGDVTELLRGQDDRFVIFGPGDLLRVRFDARLLPALPGGWKRSFVLRTSGYCKDTAPFTATGAAVEPLPFRGMSNYPPGPGEHYPDGRLHREYLGRYNTREVKPEVFPGRRRR